MHTPHSSCTGMAVRAMLNSNPAHAQLRRAQWPHPGSLPPQAARAPEQAGDVPSTASQGHGLESALHGHKDSQGGANPGRV